MFRLRPEPATVLHRAPTDDLVRPSLRALIRLEQPASALSLPRATAQALYSGHYLSKFRGRGMEFAESRPYVAGDDARSLDWRVTARTGRVHTKLFREERDRPVLVAVDYRPAMFFGTRGVFKAVLAARLAALIAWSAQHSGHRLGGVVYSGKTRIDLKPRTGRLPVLHLLQRLVDEAQPEERVASEKVLTEALTSLQRHAHTGSLVFILSDFRGLDERGETLLSRLSRHTETVLVMIHDPLERWLPEKGRFRFAANGDEITLELNPNLARTYADRFEQRLARLSGLARSHRMRWIACATDEDPLRVLQRGMRAPRHHL